MTNFIGTYVYAIVAARRRPTLSKSRRGLAGAGRVRLLELPRLASSRSRQKRWVVVADVPLARYGTEAINQRLGDLDWVSRVAVAHEAVVESFAKADGLLPMKLFTIFESDER